MFPSASGRFHIVWHRSGFQRSDFPSPQNPSTHFCSKCNKWLTASTNFLWCLIFPESGFHVFKSGKDPKRRICNLTENIWKPRNHSPIAVCPLSRCRKLTWNWMWFIIFGLPCFYTLAIWLVCIWDLHIYMRSDLWDSSLYVLDIACTIWRTSYCKCKKSATAELERRHWQWHLWWFSSALQSTWSLITKSK